MLGERSALLQLRRGARHLPQVVVLGSHSANRCQRTISRSFDGSLLPVSYFFVQYKP